MQFKNGIVFPRCRITVEVICHSVTGSKPVMLFFRAIILQVGRKVGSKELHILIFHVSA